MLTIADRHIARSAIIGMMIAMLALLALDLFLALISELKDIKNDYTIGMAVQYVLMSMPRRIITLFPISAAVGALLGIGGMAASSELVAYRAAGLSRLRIALSAVWAVIAILIPVMLMSEWLAPSAERLAEGMKSRAENAGVTVTQNASLWVRDGERIIHANKPLASSLAAGEELILADIDVFIFENDELKEVSHAKTARHDGQQWILKDVESSYLSKEKVTTSKEEQQLWSSLIDPENLKSAISRPELMPVSELTQYIGYLKENGIDPHVYEAARWRRVMYPFNAIAIVIACMPFVFGTNRSGNMGQRLFVGILLGLGFYFLSRSISGVGEVYVLPPILVEITPALLVSSIGFWFLRRSR